MALRHENVVRLEGCYVLPGACASKYKFGMRLELCDDDLQVRIRSRVKMVADSMSGQERAIPADAVFGGQSEVAEFSLVSYPPMTINYINCIKGRLATILTCK
jgi:hypothetical protein